MATSTWRTTYTPGTWIVLNGPKALVAAQPTSADIAERLSATWNDVVAATDLESLVGKLMRWGMDVVPDLIVVVEADHLQCVVRGDVTVTDVDNGQIVANGHGQAAWRSVNLDARHIAVSLPGQGAGSNWRLPLAVGVVSAGSIDIDASDDARVGIGDATFAVAPLAAVPVVAPPETPAEAIADEVPEAAPVEAPAVPEELQAPGAWATGFGVGMPLVPPVDAEAPVEAEVPAETEAPAEADVQAAPEPEAEVVEVPTEPEAEVATEPEAEVAVDAEAEVPAEPEAEAEPAAVETPVAAVDETAEMAAVDAEVAPAEPDETPAEPDETPAEPDETPAEPVADAEVAQDVPDVEDTVESEEAQADDGLAAQIEAAKAAVDQAIADGQAAPEPAEAAEPEPVPAADAAAEAEPIVEPEPAVESVPEPETVVEAAPEAVVDAVPAPVEEAVPEPVVESIPEPVVESVSEPAVESVPEPVVEAAPDSVAVAETAVADLDKVDWQPASEPVPVPDPEPAPQSVPVPEAVPAPEPAPVVESAEPEPSAATPAATGSPLGATLLVFSDGQRWPVNEPLLVGRAPQAYPGETAHLVRVVSPHHDISRTHVRVELYDGAMWATDRESTNGTTVQNPGQASATAQPGQPMHVWVGGIIDIGDGVTIRVQ